MRAALFAYGFRPMFLLCGIGGLVLVPWWALYYVAGAALATRWPPTLWHAHEMLFGFIGAAIAGFLLTAVPSWTGQKGFAGRPLWILSGLWILARIAIATSRFWPVGLPQLLDLAFMPALFYLIAPPLLRERNRNTPLLLVLIGLWLMNVLFHVAVLRQDPPLASRLMIVAIDIAVLLVSVIGGRIVPAFTASGLRASGVEIALNSRAWLTRIAVGSMVVVAVGDAVLPDTRVAGVVAAVASACQVLRLSQWVVRRVWRHPIIWVLHLAYGWIPVALALKALALLSGLALGAFWLHALTIGAISTMIMGVMTRASLGHTGRRLVASPAIAMAYGLISVAGVVRVFGLALLPLPYPLVIVLAALAWTLAFGIFVAIYGPILWLPRVDGKPG